MALSTDPVIRLISCVGVETELALLGHFIAHYRDLGIAPERMHMILNTTDPASVNLQRARALLAEAGTAPAREWIGPYTSDAMWAERRALQADIADPSDWIISADIDEFHEYPAPLPQFLKACAERAVTAVQGVFIDRLAPDGWLAPVKLDEPLAEQFPVEADVICSIGRTGQHHNWFGTVKMMAFRGELFPSRGGHGLLEGARARYLYGVPLGRFRRIAKPGFRFAVPTRVHHYKWTETLPATLERRLTTPGVSPAGAEYGGKLMRYLSKRRRIPPEDVPSRRHSAFDRLPWQLRVLWLRHRGAIEDRVRHLVLRRRAVR
jgi:hypothetical protein